MAVINTNVKALFSQAALKSTERTQSVAMQQLSTGKRINSSRDDAAGMAIATRMTQQIRSLNQSVRNAGDAVTLIQTAEGATSEITDMMQRMRELAIQASNDTNNNEQRSYLDLEFQQLKKQIVQISDNTEWNGFPVLNGSTGERVGIRPVYKTTSEPALNAGTIMTSGTAVSTTATATGGVTQTSTVSFPALATGQTVTVNGLTYTATTANSGAEVAANFANLASGALASSLTGSKGTFSGTNTAGYTSSPATGGGVTYTSVTRYTDVTATTPFVVSASGTGVLAPTVSTTTGVGGGGIEQSGTGSFAKSGILNVTMASPTTVSTAIFTLNDGQIIDISAGMSVSATGVVTINKDNLDRAGYNLLKDGNVVLSQFSAAATTLAFAAGDKLTMQVNRSFTPLEASSAGDAIINGITIGATRVVDDTISRPENAIGSAIAKAAAINEQTLLTGVHAVVNPNMMTGAPMSGTGKASGTMTINGFTTPMVNTVLDNPRESRALAVAAINFISAKTGVRAVDTFTENKGITLVADDGRNIEVAFNSATADSDFSRLTGLKTGIQAGTFSLEGNVEQNVNITTAPNGNVGRLGLEQFNYNSKTLSSVTTMDQDIASPRYNLSFSDLPAGKAITVAGLTFTATALVTAANVASVFSSLAAGSTPTSSLGAFTGALSKDFSSIAASGSSVIFSSSKALSSKTDIVVSAGAGATKPTVVNTAPVFPSLGTGDLLINGVPIRAAAASDDTLSSTQTVSSSRGSSAIATAAAINASSDLTGVTAITLPAIIQGSVTSNAKPTADGDQSLFINGVNVVVNMIAGEAPAARRDKVIAAVNGLAGYSGVEASDNGNGGLSLKAVDGRNISVWFDSDKVNAGSFGLGMGTDTNNPPGVKGAAGATQTYTGAHTVYGSVTLQSEKPIKLEPGDNGFSSEGDFTRLGFREGTFGGEVDEAVSKMSPPRTGRLAFQVGASAGQKITIDLADFGKGGPITGEITWDADLDPLPAGAPIPKAEIGGPSLMGKPLTRTSISSTEGAQAVLAKLDSAMDKVNQTRATMGAVMNRLDHVINNLTNVSMNLSASRSQIEDADYASASTELAKNQIMQQAATAVLAQANTSQQSVMKLLGG